MIISIGEILADMIGEGDLFKAFVGGAPFNVAVNAKRQGAESGFIGCVGNDVIGRLLLQKLSAFDLDMTDISIDKNRNTTMAFVAISKCGERSFTFVRHNTADYHIDTTKLAFCNDNTTIIHLGTLMLSEKVGRKKATEIAEFAQKKGCKLSVDVNFREDLYKNKEQRNQVYKPIIERADILKFSMDELLDYTSTLNLESAVKALSFNGLLFITDGAKGSYFVLNKKAVFVEAKPIVGVVDTTGAGDAFFGAILAGLDNAYLNNLAIDENLLFTIARTANLVGGKATLHKGAI